MVGSDEMDTQSVNIRNRDDVGVKGKTEVANLVEVLAKLHALKNERRLQNTL